MKRDQRIVTHLPEIREVGGQRMLCGRAVVYNQWSELLGSFRERLLPGLFDKYLGTRPDIIACVDHDHSRLLGRSAAGTLKLIPGADGIDVEIPMPDLSYARDLAVSIGRGDIRGMSFYFDVKEDKWDRSNAVFARDVVEAEIYEVSFVVFPAYPQTEVALRSLTDDTARLTGRGLARERRLALAGL